MKKILSLILCLIVGLSCFTFFGCNQGPTLKISTTIGDFSAEEFTDEERIRKVYDAGFRFMDFHMGRVAMENSPYMQSDWRESVTSIKEYADSLGVKFVQAHAPSSELLLISDNAEDRAKIQAQVVRCIEMCEILEIPNIVVHPGLHNDLTTARKQEWLEANKQAYCDQILPAAERCGVNVLCENFGGKPTIPEQVRFTHYLKTGADMRELIDYINHPNFHGCWDVGHYNLVGYNQYDHIVAVGDRLKAIHYQDNISSSDYHMVIGCGTLNHESIFNALKDINYNGYFSLECTGAQRGDFTYFGPTKEIEMLKDKKVPLTLEYTREEEEKLIFQIATYYVETYADGLFDVK
jgi:sugar phosphate isomerase/epimerase